AHARAQTLSATPRTRSTVAPGTKAAPTSTPVPLPSVVNLPGVKYVDQFDRWNYCAPANLTMALNFWGWKGNRDDVAKVVKPGENDPSKNFIDRGKSDKNVMPYELVDFVNNETDYKALTRYGGDSQMLKTLLASGFPVIAEKGIYEDDTTGRTSWMGHYQFVTGYDDIKKYFLVQDTYLKGPNYHVSYNDFMDGWRAFDRVFMVVYPAEREADLIKLLGPYSDPQWSAQHALEINTQDIKTVNGTPLFFAWFAKGTSLVALQQYVDAANAYDQAFSIYATLDSNYSTRPWRMMWYQTGPYWAYFYSGRYQDVIQLANTTLDPTFLGVNTLEESLYWRGLAEHAVGNTVQALADVRRSVYYNKNFQAGIGILGQWGSAP
ncbi:MAG: C39 family peptidase, partial [Anaerolineales bacterium]